MKKIIVSFIVGLMIAVNALPQNNGAMETITIDELKNHMYFLASDFLGGRVSYEDGYGIASEYCASQFRSVGIKPAFINEQGDSSYFQAVPLIRRKFTGKGEIVVNSNGNKFKLKYREDFAFPDPVTASYDEELDIVCAGFAISEPEHGWDDMANLEIEGKAIVLMMGTPKKKGKPVLPDAINEKYDGFPGLQSKLAKIRPQNPKAVLIIFNDELLEQVAWDNLLNQLEGESIFYNGNNQGSILRTTNYYLLHPDAGEKLFEGQKFSPGEISSGKLKSYRSLDIKGITMRSEFEIEKEEELNCSNIAAIIEGTDPVLKNEYVTIGAHLDGVPSTDSLVNYGADDNASGSIGVIEAGEALLLTPMKRSVILVLYAAEELGLHGSYHFLEEPPVPLEKIVFNINLDMIGRSSGENLESRVHNVVVYEQFLPKVKEYVSDVNEQTVNWPLDFSLEMADGYNSDHTNYNKKGIPHAFFYSGRHEDYHSPNDNADKIDYDKMQKITQLVYELTYRMANESKLNFK